MFDPSHLASPSGTGHFDAPSPVGLVRERLRSEGMVFAAQDEQPPRRFPEGPLRRAILTPPPVQFRRSAPRPAPANTPRDDVLHREFTEDGEVTSESVRRAFTFGQLEPEFEVLGVGNYSWAPRRPDQGLLYGMLDGTLRPAPARQASAPPGQWAAIIWVAAALGLCGGIALAAWTGS